MYKKAGEWVPLKSVIACEAHGVAGLLKGNDRAQVFEGFEIEAEIGPFGPILEASTVPLN